MTRSATADCVGPRPCRPCVQPVAAPASAAELQALLDAGVLVDLAGRPLVARRCGCGRRTLGETCPQVIPCRTCGQVGGRPGRPCFRPSGHQAADWHAARVAAAAAVDVERERAGDPTVPASWPPPPSATAVGERSR
jgi:hypothetical protein